MDTANSNLVEPGVKYFLRESLKQCHTLKKKYYNLYFNIGAFIFIVGLMGTILWVKYKGRLTPVEKQLKMQKERAHILEQLKSLPNPKKESGMITQLPKWQEL